MTKEIKLVVPSSIVTVEVAKQVAEDGYVYLEYADISSTETIDVYCLPEDLEEAAAGDTLVFYNQLFYLYDHGAYDYVN